MMINKTIGLGHAVNVIEANQRFTPAYSAMISGCRNILGVAALIALQRS
jgi:hypothetical protein